MSEKNSEIKFKIKLDKDNVPADIKWAATDSDQAELRDAKSIMLSIWDPIEKTTMQIDLWTKDMMVDEMHSHFFQTLMTVARSYNRATGNPFVLNDMKQFCEDLAKKTSDWEEERGNR